MFGRKSRDEDKTVNFADFIHSAVAELKVRESLVNNVGGMYIDPAILEYSAQLIRVGKLIEEAKAQKFHGLLRDPQS